MNIAKNKTATLQWLFDYKDFWNYNYLAFAGVNVNFSAR